MMKLKFCIYLVSSEAMVKRKFTVPIASIVIVTWLRNSKNIATVPLRRDKIENETKYFWYNQNS